MAVVYKGNLTPIPEEEICYDVKYVGCIEVKIGIGKLNKEKKLKIIKLCLKRVLKATNPLPNDLINLEDDQEVALQPYMEYASREFILKITPHNLTLKTRDYFRVISNIEITSISFVSDGGIENPGYVAYIGKDRYKWRACYILQCDQATSSEIVKNVGRMFQVRLKQIAKLSNIMVGDDNKNRSFPTNDANHNSIENEDDDLRFLPTRTSTLRRTSSSFGKYGNYYKNDPCIRSISLKEKTKLPETTIDKSSLIEYESWFHGLIDQSEVEQLLEENGQYLVWQKSHSPKQYVLSCLEDYVTRHFLLMDSNGVIRTRNKIFQNVSHFINFHAENALPIITPAFSITLRIAVICRNKIM